MSKNLIRFDWAMKKLLRSKANFGILEGFLSELLKRDVKISRLLESESNQHDQDGKYNRVDMLVELEGKEQVLVEVQVDTEPDYFSRMLYGTSKIVTEYLKQGEAYINVKKVYSVNILYFDLGQGKDYVYHGTTSFRGIHENDQLDLSKRQKKLYQKQYISEIYPEYYLLKVNQFNDNAKDPLDEWMYFLKNEEIKDNFSAKGLAEANEKLSALKLPDEERQEYERYFSDLSFQTSMVDTNYRMGKIEGEEIGITKGKLKGEQIGIEKGKLEGEKIGIKKGKLETQLEIVKKLKEMKMDSDTIKQITGIAASEAEE
jgi:predicted transposase/invertase (TIGR01784 family)